MTTRLEISATIAFIGTLLSAAMIIGNAYGEELIYTVMSVCLATSAWGLGGLSVLLRQRYKEAKVKRESIELRARCWDIFHSIVMDGEEGDEKTSIMHDLMVDVYAAAAREPRIVHETPILGGADRCASMTPSPSRSRSRSQEGVAE